MAFNGDRGPGARGPRVLQKMLALVGVLLVLVVIGFVVAGKLRATNWVKGLPGRLGAGISQDSNSFTYDQSYKGRKIFTIHAAKEIQRSDGKVSLHDVGIVMYGPTGQPSDRVHGSEFTYDQKAQLLTASGEVFIDLVPPAARDSSGVVLTPTAAELDRRMVHVKTIGLVFDQKAQLASSDGPVEFRSEGYTGSSVGASYDSQGGLVVLKSAVRLSGVRANQPILLTAAHAELNRKSNLVTLETAHYVASAKSGQETALAAQALIHINGSGEAEKIDAAGDVTLTSEERGTVRADRLDLDLGDRGQARAAHLLGDVRFQSSDGIKREEGSSEDARISFDAAGRPVRALMNGKVMLLEQGPADRRDLASASLDVTLGGGGQKPTVVKAAVASGPAGATLKLVNQDVSGRSATEIRAEKLSARFAPTGQATELTGLDGTGHTYLQRIVNLPSGFETARDTSTGDTLYVDFKPTEQGRSQLTRAEQRGNVASVHEAFAVTRGKAASSSVEHSRADDEVYDAASDRAHLTGNVQLQDETSALSADTVDLERATGDAAASGLVKVTYLNPSANGAVQGAQPPAPLHVIASRASAHKASGLAEFFGSDTAPARMWQGGSQVEAPVLDFYRGEKKLVAHGAAGSDEAVVRAVLVSAASALPANTPSANNRTKPMDSTGTTRILSQQMIYTDGARTLDFLGSVRVVNQQGTLLSKQATVWLTPAGSAASVASAAASSSSSSSGFMGGRVDHLVATGSVMIDQPGRRGTGEKLTYNASDGIFVLTGTRAVPPKVVDQAQGSTTGAALRFKSGDDSVEVLGSDDGRTAGRVRSETRIKQ